MEIEVTKKKGIGTRILRFLAFCGFDVPVVFVPMVDKKVKIVRRKLK